MQCSKRGPQHISAVDVRNSRMFGLSPLPNEAHVEAEDSSLVILGHGDGVGKVKCEGSWAEHRNGDSKS